MYPSGLTFFPPRQSPFFPSLLVIRILTYRPGAPGFLRPAALALLSFWQPPPFLSNDIPPPLYILSGLGNQAFHCFAGLIFPGPSFCDPTLWSEYPPIVPYSCLPCPLSSIFFEEFWEQRLRLHVRFRNSRILFLAILFFIRQPRAGFLQPDCCSAPFPHLRYALSEAISPKIYSLSLAPPRSFICAPSCGPFFHPGSIPKSGHTAKRFLITVVNLRSPLNQMSSSPHSPPDLTNSSNLHSLPV